MRVRELVDNLVDLIAHKDLQIMEGNKVVEIKDSGISKGLAGVHFIGGKSFDFILAIGDDRTDEDLFRILPDNAYSIKVGMTESYAKYNVSDQAEARKLLLRLLR